MEDFQYDYTQAIKHNLPLHTDERIDKLIKSYLFTHQFSEDMLLTREDILSIIEYFLEEDEYVFENNDKLLFILNKNNNIDKVINFLKWLFNIMSINIQEISTLNDNNKINLIVTIKNYENTFNGSRTKELYF